MLSRWISYKSRLNHARLCTHHRMQGTYQSRVGSEYMCTLVQPSELRSPTQIQEKHAQHVERFLGYLLRLEQ